MFWLKRCPKCGGDLMDESDVYGTFIGCLQCGHMLTATEERTLRDEADRRSPSPPAAAALA